MSWLVAVFFPGVLMFGTVGLQRLESLLQSDRPTAADFVARIEQLARIAREAAREAAREHTAPLPLSLKNLGARNPSNEVAAREPVSPVLTDEPGLPTKLCARAQPNPLFQPTGSANPV